MERANQGVERRVADVKAPGIIPANQYMNPWRRV